MIVMGAQADPRLLKAAADTCHEAIGSISGPNGTTLKADWDGVRAAPGRAFASVPESTVMDGTLGVIDHSLWCSCILEALGEWCLCKVNLGGC